MTNSYDIDHGLSQDAPGPLEPVEIAQLGDTLARTGNTARDQEMYAAGIRTGEENAKHNAAIRAAAPGVSTVEDEEEPPQLPYVVQRILKFAGQNQRFVTLPNLSAQQAIDLANWIQANLRPAPAAGDALAGSAPEWATCESRGPWARNSLKAAVDLLREKETRARYAFTKDYMGLPARYIADAYGEAAAVVERKLGAIAAQRKGDA
ncbi:hypothetical protein [Achromobacter xylosoxidans]|uniref:hypothetical protein n=1 Tax=Alcaligenes xylosoxydans xylosoxydans TaxID=85698 RepID=UPI0022B8B52E|nr:hypothetical protein [Achromobacter xylosoxidans]MCZ8436841.1 hypothetical protein [Achromobacter xylosoxidans]